MKKLIEGLKRAEGPDRKLDFAIGCELEIDGCVQLDDGTWDHILPGTWPAYTGSIDAAMKLIPDNYDWEMDSFTYAPDYFVKIWEAPIERDMRRGYAATPALALCIAALKARLNK